MVRTKGRRKIVCGGRRYVWYVLGGDRDYWDHYFLNNWNTEFLHIASEDKRLVLALPLSSDVPCVLSKGREFRRKTARCQFRELPFPLPESVTPKFVAEVICWAEGADAPRDRAAPRSKA